MFKNPIIFSAFVIIQNENEILLFDKDKNIEKFYEYIKQNINNEEPCKKKIKLMEIDKTIFKFIDLNILTEEKETYYDEPDLKKRKLMNSFIQDKKMYIYIDLNVVHETIKEIEKELNLTYNSTYTKKNISYNYIYNGFDVFFNLYIFSNDENFKNKNNSNFFIKKNLELIEENLSKDIIKDIKDIYK